LYLSEGGGRRYEHKHAIMQDDQDTLLTCRDMRPSEELTIPTSTRTSNYRT
jgi:hypothetical protein